ncbi:flagellar biosynthesis protein FlgE [Pollutimonas subterranea]|uniref:Flagellar hook protein FlgE n=1 Tax=Pollutimonas subterranea TaxID=2045210 RepID=A0A2N4UA55_9BURK|nr:flagellar hook protein FlgE [Pollutimonas subterranea]PLC51904.1 flagellar biosynthesis protein FlgE [Pollutimonas subterranea]
MGFGQGLSGLNAAAQNLDVIGNNIANSGTVGFKTATTTFADVYANSSIGLGTAVTGINQRFTVGTLSTTGNQFDMAIDGPKGLFRVEDTSGNVLYTRNGQFFADKDSYIVNAQGQRLTGFQPNGTTPVPIMVPVGNIAPVATTTITTRTNLDATEEVPTAAFDPDNAASYNHSLPITVYDSLGNSHQLTQYFVKTTPATSTWTVHYRLDGNLIPTSVAPTPTPVTLSFDAGGALTTTPTAATITVTPAATAAVAAPLTLSIDYNNSTQFGGPFAPNFTQSGSTTGEYASMAIASDGEIVASYTNGETQAFGYLALADFKNLQGLKAVGGNAWAETSDSGQPVIGRPGENSFATIVGQAVEESNVDLSQELVNLIIAQRTYQSNAQAIKTQDQVMQTLINMR